MSNTSGQGRGRGGPEPPLTASSACPLSCVQSSLPPTPRKVCLAKSSKFRTLAGAVCQKEAHDSGKWLFVPLPQGKGVGGGPWESLRRTGLHLDSHPQRGCWGHLWPPPRSGSAPPAPLEGTGVAVPAMSWVSSRPLEGLATAWPPVSPTHQRPGPQSPSGAADPAAGPAQGSRLCPVALRPLWFPP